MCAVQLFTLMLLAAACAEESPQYTMQLRGQQYTLEAMPQYDQQVQPTDYSSFNYEGDKYQAEFEHNGNGDAHGNQGQDFGGHNFGGHDFGGHDFGGHDFGGHNFGGHDLKPQSFAVHQHVDEEKPEPVKHYKEVLVPIPKNVQFKINQPVIIPVPHPVPIQVPVPKAVVIPIVKEISIPVEKSVPYPVERTVHVPKIKEVPFHVVKHIIVPVEKPVPFKVPVYETIIHTKKGSHKI